MAGARQDAPGRYGPFHRIESPTQTAEDAERQQRSGEIWGQAARWSPIPSVKAYRGALPKGVRGVQFNTDVRPHPNPHPTLVQWLETTSGVQALGNGFVSIAVTVTINTQVEHVQTVGEP